MTLRQRIQGWRRTGQVFSGLEGWEFTTGKIKERKELYDLYQKPGDRDVSRDYTDGQASFGSAPPEGIVYFTILSIIYNTAQPRDCWRKPNPTPTGSGAVSRARYSTMKTIKSFALRVVVLLASALPAFAAPETFQSPGVVKNLPAFHARLAEQMEYPPFLSLHHDHSDFDSWRQQARAQVMKCLLPPPPGGDSVRSVVVAEQDRGSYVARKVVFNVTRDSRVLAYLLVPKSARAASRRAAVA